MHTSLSGFVLPESVRKSTKPGCFCRIGSTSFSNVLPGVLTSASFQLAFHNTSKHRRASLFPIVFRDMPDHFFVKCVF